MAVTLFMTHRKKTSQSPQKTELQSGTTLFKCVEAQLATENLQVYSDCYRVLVACPLIVNRLSVEVEEAWKTVEAPWKTAEEALRTVEEARKKVQEARKTV